MATGMRLTLRITTNSWTLIISRAVLFDAGGKQLKNVKKKDIVRSQW
jgi:hypothetical protein